MIDRRIASDLERSLIPTVRCTRKKLYRHGEVVWDFFGTLDWEKLQARVGDEARVLL